MGWRERSGTCCLETLALGLETAQQGPCGVLKPGIWVSFLGVLWNLCLLQSVPLLFVLSPVDESNPQTPECQLIAWTGTESSSVPLYVVFVYRFPVCQKCAVEGSLRLNIEPEKETANLKAIFQGGCWTAICWAPGSVIRGCVSMAGFCSGEQRGT